MYEKGSPVRVTVGIGDGGIKELEFIGKVVIDASDFMAVQFDTVILPKMEIRAAEPLPDKPLEEILGTARAAKGGVDRPKPPKVEGVRFVVEKAKTKPRKPSVPKK